MRVRSPRCFGRWRMALAAVLVLAGCKDGDAPGADAEPASREDRAALRKQAHTEALQRAVPAAVRAIEAADPLAAARQGDGRPLRAAPLSPAALARVRDELRTARRETRGIHPDHLAPEDAVRLQVVAFALERIADALEGRPPTRTDPGLAIAHAFDMVELLEAGRARGVSTDVEGALGSMVAELRAALLDLGATSEPGLAAALEDLEQLEARVRSLAPEGGQADAIAARREVLEIQHQALPASPNAAWAHAIPSALGKPTLLRLPDTLGAADLRRRLEVEEAVVRPPAEAMPQLMQLMRRLDALATSRELDLRTPPGPRTSVDKARCLAIVTRVRQWLSASFGPEAAGSFDALDCAAPMVPALEGPRSDAELTLHVLHVGWIEPRARARRAAVEPLVARVGGRIAPASHALVASVAAAANLDDGPTLALALQRTKSAACLAGAAIWLHAELGDARELDTWLAADCPWKPPEHWRSQAIARPRRALEGLGLVLAGSGPAGTTMLDLFPWAPLGLVPVLGTPAELQHPPVEAMPPLPDIEWFGRDP